MPYILKKCFWRSLTVISSDVFYATFSFPSENQCVISLAGRLAVNNLLLRASFSHTQRHKTELKYMFPQRFPETDLMGLLEHYE